MDTRQLKRVFWIGAAGLLGLAALIALVAVVRGRFTETDGQILASLGVLFVTGSCVIGATALLDRRQAIELAWAAIAIAAVSFPVIVSFLWRDFQGDTHERLFGSAWVLLTAAILFTTGRLLLRAEHLRILWYVQLALFTFVGAMLLGFIWSDDASEGLGKLVAAVAILASLAWFLTPVLQRLQGVSGPSPAPGDNEHMVIAAGGIELVVAPSTGPLSIRADGNTLVITRGGETTRLGDGQSVVVRRSS